METKNIIIILLVIVVVVLAVILGSMFMPSLNAQKDSKIAIVGNKTLHEGDNLTVKLTDLNKTPIGKGAVNVTVTDKKGKVVMNESVKTNSKGKASVDLDLKPGKYSVNVTFGGNDNFTGNSTSKNITIEEKAAEEAPASSTADTSSYSEPKTYASGLTEEEVEGYIQRDLDERAKRGINEPYDYEGARQFYENVPPTGMA